MKHRKTFAFAAIALLALLPLTVFAEGFGRHGGRGPGGRGIFPPPGYLDLTDEQKDTAEAIRDSVRTEMEGTRDQRSELHEQLRAELDGGSPDAATVGQLVIDTHNLRAQTRAIMENGEREFAALLTPEQLEKWENFKELRRERRGSRHRGGPGHGPGGPGGGGPLG